MDTMQNFKEILETLGQRLNVKLELDENGHCDFPVDADVVVSIEVLPNAQAILLWTSLGRLPDDEFTAQRAAYLLRFQDQIKTSRGFTIGFDSEDHRAVIHDVRPMASFDSEDKLAAWLDALVTNVLKIREEIETLYPYDDDAEELPELP